VSEDRRNPYLVLGVPFGASREQATRSFALRSRRARREPNFPYSIDDLTWALNQVEAALVNPTADVATFRVPADAAAVRPPSGSGVLRRPPIPLGRRTAAATPAEIARLESIAISEELVEILDQASPLVASRYGIDEGVIAVRLTGEPGRRRGPLLGWSLAVVAAIAIAVALVLSLGGGKGESSPPSTTRLLATTTTATRVESPPPTAMIVGPITTYAPDTYDSSSWTSIIGAEDLLAGRCFDFEATDQPNEALVVSRGCSIAHRFQVIGISDVGTEVVAYTDVLDAADAICRFHFGGFVGSNEASSRFEYGFVYPSPDGWPEDRRVTCYVFLQDERRWAGSAEGIEL